jgi:hypothetical protein
MKITGALAKPGSSLHDAADTYLCEGFWEPV